MPCLSYCKSILRASLIIICAFFLLACAAAREDAIEKDKKTRADKNRCEQEATAKVPDSPVFENPIWAYPFIECMKDAGYSVKEINKIMGETEE